MRAIDGDHLKKWIISHGLEYSKKGNNLTAADIIDQIDREPSVQPERKKGKGQWLEFEDNTSFVSRYPRRWIECSECRMSYNPVDKNMYHFCPNCGADMRGNSNGTSV